MHIILIFLIYFILQSPAFADDSTIWDYPREDFLQSALTDDNSFLSKKRHEKIDEELEKNLKVKLVPINLEECLKIAVANNYTIKQKKATERENLWNKYNAYSKFLPNVSYGYTIQWLSGTYLVGGIVADNVHEIPKTSNFNVDWNLFERGRAFFDTAQKRNSHKQSVALYKFSRDEIILKTAISYYELLKNKIRLDVYTTNLADRKAQYDLTTARYNVGVGTRFDIYRAEAELAKANQEYITAFNSIRISQAKLANYMGIDVAVPLYPKTNTISQKKLSEIDVDKLISLSKQSRFDLIAERKKIEAMKAERSAIYTEFIPDVNLSYRHARNGTQRLGMYPSNTCAINITAPLGENIIAGSLTKIKAANYKIDAEKYNLIQMSRNIEEAIITSKQNSESANERIASSKKEVYSSAKSLENAIVLMNVGTSTFIDVIQAQSLKVNAEVGLIENITDYNIAQVQLLFDSGIISVDNVLNGVQFTP